MFLKASSFRRKIPGNHPRPAFDAVAYLTVFLILTCAVPSYLTIPALGSVGRPTTLWGIAGLFWWGLYRLGRPEPIKTGSRGFRLAILSFVICVLISYAQASFRGLPPAESSVADSGLLRMAGWVGVALVANDGIGTMERLRTLLERIAIAGGLMALLGLAQFWTGNSLIDWMSIPGLTVGQDVASVQNRAGFARAAGTATHPLEYGVVLCMALPISIAMALTKVHRVVIGPVLYIVATAAALYLSVSRSALIGACVGIIVAGKGWTGRVRRRALFMTLAGGVAAFFVIPGMTGTIRGLFMGVGTDASTLSRTNSYDLALSIANRNPFFGRGFLTLLPEYVILDNQYLGILIELGYVGLSVTGILFVFSLWVAARAGNRAVEIESRIIGFSIAASMTSGITVFAFFDGLAFSMSAGFLFLITGVAGAVDSLWTRGAASVCNADGTDPSQPPSG